ncbi:Glycolate dehydrogenase, FAD-binding subunit GlcE [Candidatus Paraburkholderia calva]|nr:Glycolate dehydrogenase, FAD-binding subunit GlcE [Candidatus Paraburkholderia calva]
MEQDDIVAGWSERIARATETGTPLCVRGGGTKDWYGQTLQGEILDTRAHRDIVAYDPAELVITESGTPLAKIEATLREYGQMLSFEPPHFGRGATLGGCIAGPRRAWTGATRDFVLGAVVMNGHGHVLHFGGQVVKNVAGYDVSRLLAGSLGTLGLILELSIKVLPRPVAKATLKFDMHATDGVRKLNEWGDHPLPITGSAWRDGTLALRLAGAEAAVKSAHNRLGGEVVDAVEADRFWIGLREQTDPFFAVIEPRSALWRLALPSIAEPLHLPGAQLM